MIVSVSRRTDIPYFFGKWFIQHLKQGEVKVKNPFNHGYERTVSLHRENVDAFVFWTRNPLPFIPMLDIIDRMNIPYYFLITINNYPDFLEPYSLELKSLKRTLQMLKYRIGESRIIWRYDPIIISPETPISFHQQNFLELIGLISPYSKKVIVSLIDMYPKVKKRFEKIGFKPLDIREEPEKLEELLVFLSRTAEDHAVKIQGCAEDLNGTKSIIKKGKCIDDSLINSIFNLKIKYQKDRGQRPGCWCQQSVDIGQYGTCRFNCLYCYAL
jgi:hypothetical protein